MLELGREDRGRKRSRRGRGEGCAGGAEKEEERTEAGTDQRSLTKIRRPTARGRGHTRSDGGLRRPGPAPTAAPPLAPARASVLARTTRWPLFQPPVFGLFSWRPTMVGQQDPAAAVARAALANAEGLTGPRPPARRCLSSEPWAPPQTLLMTCHLRADCGPSVRPRDSSASPSTLPRSLLPPLPAAAPAAQCSSALPQGRRTGSTFLRTSFLYSSTAGAQLAPWRGHRWRRWPSHAGPATCVRAACACMVRAAVASGVPRGIRT